LDRLALQKFFAYGYFPAPHTLFLGARKLPGGCQLVYNLRTGDVSSSRYWHFELREERNGTNPRETDLIEELRALLSQAVHRRLISDVPLGIFLSGGIDSSSILASMARLRGSDDIKSFTIGFTEPSFDESLYAREVATEFHTRHHVQTLDLTNARDLIPIVLSQLDEPLGDPSIVPTFLLSRFTREHVTVALSGDGGDELFAGYDPFAALWPASCYERFVPWVVHRGMRKLADLLPISNGNMSFDFKLRRSLTGLSYAKALWNPVWMAPVEPELIKELFHEPLKAHELYGEAISLWDRDPKLDIVDRTLVFFTNLYLQDNILTKVDRATMLNSLESRAVFLDNDLVEFCQRLPNRFKYRNGQRKYLLKKAMAGILPPTILKRRKKGFGIPLAQWLRDVPLVPPLAPVDNTNAEWVSRQWREHRNGAADHRYFLWSWLSLQTFLAGPRSATPEVIAA